MASQSKERSTKKKIETSLLKYIIMLKIELLTYYEEHFD